MSLWIIDYSKTDSNTITISLGIALMCWYYYICHYIRHCCVLLRVAI